MLSGFQTTQDRRIIGLMSGTSADGIDAAVIRLGEKDDGLSLDVLGFDTVAFPTGLRHRLMEVSDSKTGRIDELSRLHFELGELFARAAFIAADSTGLSMEEIDLIGSHGQTVQHLPDGKIDLAWNRGDAADRRSFGDRSANRRGDGWRLPDGGRGPVRSGRSTCALCGLPALRHPEKARGLLNLGGIANLTVLPADSKPGDVLAFDTGPATC